MSTTTRRLARLEQQLAPPSKLLQLIAQYGPLEDWPAAVLDAYCAETPPALATWIESLTDAELDAFIECRPDAPTVPASVRATYPPNFS